MHLSPGLTPCRVFASAILPVSNAFFRINNWIARGAEAEQIESAATVPVNQLPPMATVAPVVSASLIQELDAEQILTTTLTGG